MELLTSKITENFEPWQHSLVIEGNRFWRSLWISQILSVGLAVFVLLLPIEYPWKISASLAPFFPLLFFWGYRDLLARASNSRLLGALLILIACFLNLAFSFGVPIPQGGIAITFNGIGTWWAILIPLITIPMVLRLRKEAPIQGHHLGLSGTHLVWYIAFGFLSGIALAASFTLTEMQFKFVSPESLQQNPTFSWNIWWIALVGGALVPAEELALRGKVLTYLSDVLKISRTRSVILVTILNSSAWIPISMLLWPLSQASVIIAYRLILAAVNSLWFFNKRSLIPGLMANFVFSVWIGWILHP